MQGSPAEIIAHAQFGFEFGAQERIVRHPDQESFDFDFDLARLVDPWKGSAVFRAATCRSIPFRGDGDEDIDWTWNLDTLSAGIIHKVIPQTAVFRRIGLTADHGNQIAQAGFPAETPLCRYDSALYGTGQRPRALSIGHDAFLDRLSDIDIVQLHILFLGRVPDPAMDMATVRKDGLARLVGNFIRSKEFAARLDRMLQTPAAANQFEPATAQALAEWIEHRFEISLAGTRPVQMAYAALATVLTTFPCLPLFEQSFGSQSADTVARLKQAAEKVETPWSGYIDHCSGDLIRGWVISTDQTGPVTIAIKVDGVVAGIAEASLYRRDVAHILSVNGMCGFEVVPVLDWNRILNPAPQVTLHDVATGELIPISAKLANQRRSDIETDQDQPEDIAEDQPWHAGVRLERYDALLAPRRLPAAPFNITDTHEQPVVTVVVRADQGNADDLAKTLRTVFSQDYPAIQLLVVEGGSAGLFARSGYAHGNSRISVTVLHAGADEQQTGEQIFAAARGEYLCLVPSGCLLDDVAIGWFAYSCSQFGAKLVYADDLISRYLPGNIQHSSPRLKPPFDYDLLLQQNYIGDMFCVSKSVFGAMLNDGIDKDDTLVLHLAEHVPQRRILHVPFVLHRREGNAMAEPETPDPAHRRAVEQHVTRRGLAAVLRDDPINARLGWSGNWYPHWPPQMPRQRLAIIIPTRDRVELLKPCIDSLLARMADPASCEILIVDNGSTDTATLRYFDGLRTRSGIRVIPDDGEFNWSALNNTAVSHTNAELLLFANNDIEIFTRGFDDILRGLLERPEIGAVGNLLLYPNGAIQHAGTALGVGGVADHIGAGRMPINGQLGGMAQYQRSVGAVTGAFMAVARSTFDQVGGFDAADLKIAFSDVDLCLKINALGQHVLYTPRILCLHHESASRGLDTIDPVKNARANAEIQALKKRWGTTLATDPFYNIGYDRHAEPFTTARIAGLQEILDDLKRQADFAVAAVPAAMPAMV